MYTVTYTDRNGATHTAVLASADATYVNRLIDDKPAKWLVSLRNVMAEEYYAHNAAANYTKADGISAFVDAVLYDVTA